MTIEREEFLRDGLDRYAAARDAVDEYERDMKNRLLDVLEAKKEWRHFRPRDGERGRGKARAADVGSSADGRWIYAYQNGAEENEGLIDLLLWWRSPVARDGVILCASRWDPGYRLRSVKLANPKDPVVCGVVNQNKARLYVPFQRDADLKLLGGLLLDELDRALGEG